MNKRKIWMMAFLFGLIATVIFYTGFMKEPAASKTIETDESASEVSEEEVDETEEESETAQDVKESSLLEIEEGKRAISIAVDSIQGVSNFLNPGDFVDVALVHPPAGEHKTPFTVVLFENIKVLATGERTIVNHEAASPAYGAVTLELTAIDGAKLSLATEKGRIMLMKRPPDDSSTASDKHLDESNLHTWE